MTASEKFAEAISIMNCIAPQYCYFYDLFNRQSTDDEQVTIRTNMKDDIHPILEYNEDFVKSIKAPTLALFICIETNRLLLRHLTKRRLSNTKINYLASNIVCCDDNTCALLEYDFDTIKLKRELPNDSNQKIRAMLPENYNHDTDCVLEILYEMLLDDKQEQDNASNKSKSKLDANVQKELESIQQYFDPKNANVQTEKWGENSLAEIEIAKRVNDASVADWGNMPNDLREKIKAANENVVDPRKALNRFIATAYSNKFTNTRMKMNRRMQQMIGKVPGKRHEQEFKIGIFADASGSMSTYDLELCLQTINQFVRTGAQVEYAWWDCKCEIPSRILKPANEATCVGGGGTDPNCILEMMHKNKLKYDGMIVITDCGFNWQKPKEWKNIFIVRTPNAINAPEWVNSSRQMSMKDVKEYVQ